MGYARLRAVGLLELVARAARRARLGALVDKVGPRVSGAVGRFSLELDGLVVGGRTLGHQHYVRELVTIRREQMMLDLLVGSVTPGGTVVEGGAYIGFVTLHAARAAGAAGRVIAFEPDPTNARAIEDNVRANGFESSVEVVRAALGAAPATARFYRTEGGATSGLYPTTEAAVPVDVRVVRGDDVVARRPVDVIKLDLEGGEVAALAGFERTIAGSPRITLFVECHPEYLALAGSSAAELVSRLERLDFDVVAIDEDRRALVRVDDALARSDYVNLYCARRRG